MNCKDCKEDRVQTANVPYIVHEGMLSRMERTQKRLYIIILVLISLLVLSNFGWLYYENQFEEVHIEQDSERGVNNYIGNDGDIYNGEADYYLP